MREQFRPTAIDVTFLVLGLLVIADIWVDLDGSKVTATVLTVALVVLRQWTAAKSARRTQAAESAAALEHARAAGEVRAVIEAGINSTIVEVVAAQQAVVRSAYADDILTRLNAADESAHAALTSLDLLNTR